MRDEGAWPHFDLFYEDLFCFFGGVEHGLSVEVFLPEHSVGVFGPLPKKLRETLRQVAPPYEPLRRRIPWTSGSITWCEDARGRGVRYAPGNLAGLLDLVVERRFLLEDSSLSTRPPPAEESATSPDAYRNIEKSVDAWLSTDKE